MTIKKNVRCEPVIQGSYCCAIFFAQPAMSQFNVQITTWFVKGTLNGSPASCAVNTNVSGDPAAEGKPLVLRIRCPDGAKVPPHWHPTDENITVLKGNFMIGTGRGFRHFKRLLRWTPEISSLCQKPCGTLHCAKATQSSRSTGSGRSRLFG